MERVDFEVTLKVEREASLFGVCLPCVCVCGRAQFCRLAVILQSSLVHITRFLAMFCQTDRKANFQNEKSRFRIIH